MHRGVGFMMYNRRLDRAHVFLHCPRYCDHNASSCIVLSGPTVWAARCGAWAGGWRGVRGSVVALAWCAHGVCTGGQRGVPGSVVTLAGCARSVRTGGRRRVPRSLVTFAESACEACLGERSSFDSVLDDDRHSSMDDSLFKRTGLRSSVSSDLVFGYDHPPPSCRASSAPSRLVLLALMLSIRRLGKLMFGRGVRRAARSATTQCPLCRKKSISAQ